MAKRKTIAIFPGSFKPPTRGHLDAVKHYSKVADEVVVLVSDPKKKTRQTATGKTISAEMAKKIFDMYVKAAKLKNVTVTVSALPSPVAAAFEMIETLRDVDVMLGASKKDGDWKRWKSVPKWVEKNEIPVTILDPEKTAVPPTTSGDDEVSASYIRQNVTDPDAIRSHIPDEISDSDFAKIVKMLNEGKTGTFAERFRLLQEGGAAGHMSHPFDNREFTFKDLKVMIDDILTGKLDFEEKTDGQNLQVTWKDGKLGAARNKTTIKEPIDTDQVTKKFSGHPAGVRDAFVNSMKSLESAISTLSDDEKERIFKGGSVFINLEIIYPPSKNVIDYGNQALLQFHGATEYDTTTGKKVKDDKRLGSELYSLLQKHDALNQKPFTIIGPRKLSLKDVDFAADRKKFKSIIDTVVAESGMKDGDTVGEFYRKEWEKEIDGRMPDLSPELLEALVDRYTGAADQVNLRILKKMANGEGHLDELVALEKEKVAVDKRIGHPLEKLFLQLGALVLSNVSGVLALNPDKTVSSMKSELDSLVAQVKSDEHTGTDLLDKMDVHLGRLNSIGLDKIAPLEGLVFRYGDKVFKLTGAFAPLNALLGLIKFRR